MSTPEWLKEIKRSIATGSRTAQHESSEQYINAVGLWKERCNTFQQEIHELFTTNMNLEQKLDKMRRDDRAHQSTPFKSEVIVVATPSPVVKRKQDLAAPSHRPTKKPKVRAEERVNDAEDALKITETGEREE
jgi:hypothetical protein